jgi:hypothetical protein
MRTRKLIAVCVSAAALGCVGCECVQLWHEHELRKREEYERLKADLERSRQQPESSGLGDNAPPTVPGAN